MVIHYLEKEVQNKPAGNKYVNIVDKDSRSYSTDGGVQLNKNCNIHVSETSHQGCLIGSFLLKLSENITVFEN